MALSTKPWNHSGDGIGRHYALLHSQRDALTPQKSFVTWDSKSARLDEAKIFIEIASICLNATDLARRCGMDEYGVHESEYSVNVNSALYLLVIPHVERRDEQTATGRRPPPPPGGNSATML
uniref:Uncharacterized protein n=1 Tax=Bionectria ochroleuca TaxID=29856 RepID=A0A8H7NAV9_BIOOC